MRVTAALSAMTLEIETLGRELTDKKEVIVQGDPVHHDELERQEGCARSLGDWESECSHGGHLFAEQFQPAHLLFTGIAGGLTRTSGPAMS